MTVKNGTTTLIKVLAVANETKRSQLSDPAVPLLTIYLSEMKQISTKHFYMNVHSNFICNNSKLEIA